MELILISPMLLFSITCFLKPASPLLKANFEIPIISETVIHLLQNGGEALPSDQADKMKLVG